MSEKHTTGPYQRQRKNTLRGVARAHQRAVALDLLKENRKNGKHYPKRIERALRAQ